MKIMVLKSVVRGFIRAFRKLGAWAEEPERIYEPRAGKPEEASIVKEIHSLWDYLKFSEHTQAYHLVNVIGFDEWVDMGEIRRRILELFKVNYKNERSLYPYIKTMADIGLLETTNIGGRRKWRKKDVIIKL